MGKKEQVPARAVFLRGFLRGCGRRLEPTDPGTQQRLSVYMFPSPEAFAP